MWGDDIYDTAYADRIRGTRLSENDVQGTYLPPLPNQTENDATVLGVDVNDNSIRDDVEVKIFAMYPGDDKKRERVAALQYAQAEQLLFRWVIGKESMEAYLEKDSKAFMCISDLNRPAIGLADMGLTDEEINELSRQYSRQRDMFEEPFSNMIQNTSSRKNAYKDLFRKHMTGYSLPSGEQCDIAIPKQ